MDPDPDPTAQINADPKPWLRNRNFLLPFRLWFRFRFWLRFYLDYKNQFPQKNIFVKNLASLILLGQAVLLPKILSSHLL